MLKCDDSTSIEKHTYIASSSTSIRWKLNFITVFHFIEFLFSVSVRSNSSIFCIVVCLDSRQKAIGIFIITMWIIDLVWWFFVSFYYFFRYFCSEIFWCVQNTSTEEIISVSLCVDTRIAYCIFVFPHRNRWQLAIERVKRLWYDRTRTHTHIRTHRVPTAECKGGRRKQRQN